MHLLGADRDHAPAEPLAVGQTHVRAHGHPVPGGQRDALPHRARVAGVRAAGDVGRGDQRHHLGVGAVAVDAEALAQVAVDVHDARCRGHGAAGPATARGPSANVGARRGSAARSQARAKRSNRRSLISRPDHLQPHRQALVGETDRDARRGQRGLRGQDGVGRERQRRPALGAQFLAGRGGHLHGRVDEDVDAGGGHDRAQPAAQVLLAQAAGQVLGVVGGFVGSGGDVHDEVGEGVERPGGGDVVPAAGGRGGAGGEEGGEVLLGLRGVEGGAGDPPGQVPEPQAVDDGDALRAHPLDGGRAPPRWSARARGRSRRRPRGPRRGRRTARTRRGRWRRNRCARGRRPGPCTRPAGPSRR